MFTDTCGKMTNSFADIASITASTSKFGETATYKRESNCLPSSEAKISENIDHFEEVIHPQQRRKHAFSFVNNLKPPGVPQASSSDRPGF